MSQRNRKARKEALAARVAAGTWKPKPLRSFFTRPQVEEVFVSLGAVIHPSELRTTNVRKPSAALHQFAPENPATPWRPQSQTLPDVFLETPKGKPRCSGQGCAVFHTDKNDEERN